MSLFDKLDNSPTMYSNISDRSDEKIITYANNLKFTDIVWSLNEGFV
jgi:hypothetical protein